MSQAFVLALVLSFIIAVIFIPILIPALQKLKFGQFIRGEGPESHLKKAGTPTMGGIGILLALVLGSFITAFITAQVTSELLLVLFVTVANGFVGFLDDMIKIKKQRNLGLTSKQKLIGQLLIAVLFYIGLMQINISTVVNIPGTTMAVDLHGFYILLVVVMILGASNGTNLTDGLDGLLSGTTVVAFLAYAVLAWQMSSVSLLIFAVAMVGSALGFLWFNKFPAKVFMGDTGSLAIGSGIAALAILLKSELLLIIIGGIFVIETLSVILQVVSFQLTGRRVFKMSPIHHHFDLLGWSEWRIVTVFWSMAAVFGLIGVCISMLP